jgi:nuclear pore complex protein Nup133
VRDQSEIYLLNPSSSLACDTTMFAPKAATSAASLRNPRRRQRTSSGESIKPPNAKRQRSILRQNETFKTADLTEREPDYRSLEHPTPTGPGDADATLTSDGDIQRSIPIRTTKKHEKRKGDTINPVVLVRRTLLRIQLFLIISANAVTC